MYHWVTTTHRTVSKVVPAEEMVLAVAAKVTVASRAVVLRQLRVRFPVALGFSLRTAPRGLQRPP